MPNYVILVLARRIIMKKDRLNMKEEKLFEVIKQLVESNGSKYTASLKLVVSLFVILIA